jgi:hypothetical protein
VAELALFIWGHVFNMENVRYCDKADCEFFTNDV